MEREMAYGFSVSRVSTTGFSIRLVAFKQREIQVQLQGASYRARVAIEGKPAILNRIFVQTEKGGGLLRQLALESDDSVASPISLVAPWQTPASRIEPSRREIPRVLFICGSRNQTTQLHKVAREMPDFHQRFTPYFVTGAYELIRQWGGLSFTIAGGHWREECLAYLRANNLPIDVRGEGYEYDLVVTCQDLFVPELLKAKRAVLVQEGMVDPVNAWFHLVRRVKWLPRWLASTSATGLSDCYDKFCVASNGFRDLFVRRGVRPEKMVVTGLPNFSQCDAFLDNSFPHRGYALVCTSDSRETFKLHNRRAFLRHARHLADGRQVIVKLHPNERFNRAIGEVQDTIPGALVFTTGSAEEMVANCDLLITEWSSTALVGLALNKEVHSMFKLEELRRLVPMQTPDSASNIAEVCRSLVMGYAKVQNTASIERRVKHQEIQTGILA